MFEHLLQKLSPERVGYGFLLFGVLLIAIGLLWAGSSWRFISHAVKTDGVLLRVSEVQTKRFQRRAGEPSTSITRYAVAEFHDENGTRHETECLLPTSTDSLNSEDRVIVYYDRKDPRASFIDHWMVLWFAPGLFVVLGTFWVVFVGGCLWLMLRGMRG